MTKRTPFFTADINRVSLVESVIFFTDTLNIIGYD